MEIKHQNIVMLGKNGNFPKWPCIIIDKKSVLMENSGEDEEWFLVQYFKTYSFSWLNEQELSSYFENIDSIINTNDEGLLEAIREAETQLALEALDPCHIIKTNEHHIPRWNRQAQNLPEEIATAKVETVTNSDGKKEQNGGTSSQSVTEIAYQTIMWGKLNGFPPWPCLIIDEFEYEGASKPSLKNENTKLYPVYFFGDSTYAWLEEQNLFNYKENRDKYLTEKINKNKVFMRAVCEAEYHLMERIKDENYFVEIKRHSRLRSKNKSPDGEKSFGDEHIFTKIAGNSVEVKENFEEQSEDQFPGLDDADIPTPPFPPQTLLWGKITGYPPWPCLVLSPEDYDPESNPESQHPGKSPVHFFGDNSFAWLHKNSLYEYKENRERFINISKNKNFLNAVSEADCCAKKQEENENYVIHFDKKRVCKVPGKRGETALNVLSDIVEKLDNVEMEVDAEIESDDETEMPRQKIMWGKLNGRLHWPCILQDIEEDEGAIKYLVRFFCNGDNEIWLRKDCLFNYTRNRAKFLSGCNHKRFLRAVHHADEYIRMEKQEEEEEELYDEEDGFYEESDSDNDDNEENESARMKLQSAKRVPGISGLQKVGIIGVGYIGAEIAFRLLEGGYELMLYDEDFSKWKKLKDELEKIGTVTLHLSAYGVLKHSDVIFLCLSDEDRLRYIVEYNFSFDVLDDDVLHKKGIFNMTTVDPDLSLELSKKIERNGGTYLEIAFQGDRIDASLGKLKLYAAGNATLFDDSQPILGHLGICGYFVGIPGHAIKLNLVLQMMKGVNLAVLGEGIALAERLGIERETFVDVFNDTSLSGFYTKRKSAKMLTKDFDKVEESLDGVRNDLERCVDVANEAQHPLTMAHSANEVFKHCQKFHYGSQDATAVVFKNPFYF